jgi:thiosulfate/3-mercaptopyruvate sulfurtransferase
VRGDETLLVAGDAPAERDFVAGMLYLAGAGSVLILAESVSRLTERDTASGGGTARAFARAVVFEAPMRDNLIVLGHELRAARPLPALLDGRGDEEYWGATVRAARGGHLPGAQNLPAARLRPALGGGGGILLPEGSPVAYGHDAVEGIAYFTLLRAGHGVPARVYPAGWSEWAADGSLPADAVSHPDRAALAVPAAEKSGAISRSLMLALAVILVVAAFGGGYFLARRRHA